MNTNAISQRPDAHAAVMDAPRFDVATGTIEIATPYEGAVLSFDPAAKVITPQQLAVLAPLGVEANWSIPHVAAFLADCYRRGFDPWVKEAFLMRYPGDKYVRHIGIAGFLRKAEETGQFEGLDQVVFFDQEDRPFKRWPRSDQVPYAAEVTVYRAGRRPTTTAISYDEYVPMMDDVVWKDGRRVPTGKGKVPVPMWRSAQDGGKPTVMLAKCVRAAALRLAFPNTFSGFYEPAEFERAASELADLGTGDERAKARREAYAAANGAGPVTEGSDIGVEVHETVTVTGSPAAAAEQAEPATADQAGPAETPEAPMDADRARELLLGELAAQARLLGGVDVALLTKKWSQARDGQDFATATLATMTAHVHRYREYVITKLRESGRHGLADRYEAAPVVGTLDDLFGTTTPWAHETAHAGAGTKTTTGQQATEQIEVPA